MRNVLIFSPSGLKFPLVPFSTGRASSAITNEYSDTCYKDYRFAVLFDKDLLPFSKLTNISTEMQL